MLVRTSRERTKLENDSSLCRNDSAEVLEFLNGCSEHLSGGEIEATQLVKLEKNWNAVKPTAIKP